MKDQFLTSTNSFIAISLHRHNCSANSGSLPNGEGSETVAMGKRYTPLIIKSIVVSRVVGIREESYPLEIEFIYFL